MLLILVFILILKSYIYACAITVIATIFMLLIIKKIRTEKMIFESS